MLRRTQLRPPCSKSAITSAFWSTTTDRPSSILATPPGNCSTACTLDEAERYLRDRAAKGFTVIQTVVLAEIDGLHTPNMRGDLPLIDDDPTQPNEAYFAHVDEVVALAAALWPAHRHAAHLGRQVEQEMGRRPGDLHARERPRLWRVRRRSAMRDQPIIWILGGDRPIESDEHRAIVRAMAEGVREGDGGRNLITFHTWGPHSTSEYVHDEPWLDFHTCQSGHAAQLENWRFIEADYARTPTRPCMDAEPGYEDMRGRHPQPRRRLSRRLRGAQGAVLGAVRRRARPHLWLLAVWQMWDRDAQAARSGRVVRGTRRCTCPVRARCSTHAR